MNLDKVCIILRGTSSSGKTTFSQYLANTGCVICCADDYFTDSEGNYNFNPEKLGEAHNQCKQTFLKALERDCNLIIVSNTNTKEKEFSFYIDAARRKDYTIFSLVVEKRHEEKNNHNVPHETLERQAGNIKNSLKLL